MSSTYINQIFFECLIRCYVIEQSLTSKQWSSGDTSFLHQQTHIPVCQMKPGSNPQTVHYLIKAISLLWLPSLRPLGGFCQSSSISPRQLYPRRSPYNPLDPNAGVHRLPLAQKQQQKKRFTVLMVLTRQPMPRITMEQLLLPALPLLERKTAYSRVYIHA